MVKITIKEIKQKMEKHYGNQKRKMTITFILNQYETVGTVLFTLCGSPPKGYALYIPDHHQLSFYDGWWQRWSIGKNTEIPEIDKQITDRDYTTSDVFFGN